jgi:hypothetical protein
MVAAIVDLFYFLSIIFLIGYECEGCGNSYGWQIWYNWIYFYFSLSNMTVSNYLEVAATFDCYLMINNRLKCLQTNKFFKGMVPLLIIMGFSINFHNVFTFRINESKNIFISPITNVTINTSIYYSTVTSYFFTNLYNVMNNVTIFIRELLPIVILIILNVLTLLTLRKVMKKKYRLQNKTNNSNTTANTTTFSSTRSSGDNNTNRMTSQAEINKLKMIIIICSNYILLRIPFAVEMSTNNIKNSIWFCEFFQISFLFYNFSYFMKFIIFFIFNKHFKKHLKSIFKFY